MAMVCIIVEKPDDVECGVRIRKSGGALANAPLTDGKNCRKRAPGDYEIVWDLRGPEGSEIKITVSRNGKEIAVFEDRIPAGDLGGGIGFFTVVAP